MFLLISNYLEPIACLLYFVSLVFHYRVQKQRVTKLLIFHYLIITILLTIGAIQIQGTESNNIWFYDIANLSTAIFIGTYFYYLLQHRTKKKIVSALVTIYILYSVFRHFTLEGDRLFDSIGYSFVSASVVIYVFMYFHQALKNVTEISILKEFNFWLASGYLVYFAGSFIIFVSYYYLTKKILHTYTTAERDILTALWGMHNALLFISALSLLTGSLWITYRRKSP